MLSDFTSKLSVMLVNWNDHPSVWMTWYSCSAFFRDCLSWGYLWHLGSLDLGSVLESKKAIANELKTAFFGFQVGLGLPTLPAWVIQYIKLYHLRVIVMFTYETKACKFSASFNFCGKERSFHIVSIPISWSIRKPLK